MSIIGSNILAGASGNQGGYNINNSLRFRASASAYLNRTPAGAGNRKTWTWSSWFKRGTLGTFQVLFGVGNVNTGTSFGGMYFTSTDTLIFFSPSSGGFKETNQVFRDPSAWYHLVVYYDTPNSVVKLYVNGTEITAFSTNTNPSANVDGNVNAAVLHNIGKNASTSQYYFDGYLAEVNFIDGYAYTPSSFGETSLTTGSWIPKAYTGTYGTNGFYLKFSDIATTSGSNAGLGKDFSGNANYWTTNNISVTAGVTYDAMIDSPTLTSATVGNYAVLNPLSPTGATCADGNLQATITTSNKWTVGTFAVSSGKYYFECVLGGSTPELAIGIAPNSGTTASSNALHYYSLDGNVYSSNSSVATGATFTSGDIIGVAFEPSGNAYFYKNNTLQATVSMPAGSDWCAEVYQTSNRSNTATVNFGQRPFTYTPPSGFVRLNTFNLPDSTIVQGNKVMDATLYTGTGASLSVTNAGSFKPDLVWVKGRSGATDHAWYDSVRGTTKDLVSNSSAAETTQTTGLTAFGTGGFTVGALAKLNTSAATYVGWQWQAGQGSSSSNTAGTITSTVSVNTTAGFSVVTYTGTGANATVGHGLGVAPSWVIVKRRDTTADWQVRHTSITAANSIQLNLTNASASATTVWNSTAPTSTVFSIGTSTDVNASAGTYVAYCWAEIAGFSKFGSYTGNGSADGAFIFTGFTPKCIIIKCTDTVGTAWVIYDTARDTYNQMTNILLPNAANAELSGYSLDVLSNGFKHRQGGGDPNASGRNYIYACFAFNPFKNSNAR